MLAIMNVIFIKIMYIVSIPLYIICKSYMQNTCNCVLCKIAKNYKFLAQHKILSQLGMSTLQFKEYLFPIC